MLRYIFKRILIFIPTLIVITLLGFIISVNAPGDPVELMISAPQSGGEMGSQTQSQIEQKKIWREKLGWTFPFFISPFLRFPVPIHFIKYILKAKEKRSTA